MDGKNSTAVLEVEEGRRPTTVDRVRPRGQIQPKEDRGNIKFICRICKATDFEEKYDKYGGLGPGGRCVRLYCFCSGCSVVFIDPEKFSLK